MGTDHRTLQAPATADLPWHADPSMRGILRLEGEALVFEPSGPGHRAAIPLLTIQSSSIETTLGLRPALHVRHRLADRDYLSRFEFLPDAGEDEEPGSAPDLAHRVGPGLARDAASHLEGGLRALSGGLRGGRRVVRQAVEGVARQEEYRAWPEAIARARSALRGSRPSQSTPFGAAGAAPPIAPPPPVIPDGVEVPSGDARSVLAWFNAHVVAWLSAAGTRARELAVRDLPVLAPAYPLDSPLCRIVVAGEFSRGKSTLINALFGIHGELALPTGMTPTTPLACAIRVPNVGESDGATITYRSRRPPLELTLDAFRAGVRVAEERDEPAGSGPDLYLAEARRVEVRVTGAYLPAGVEIEDTPGLHEAATRSAAAEAAIGRADLVLFVLAADQLLGNLEQEVIDRVLRQGFHRNLLFLVNFWDSITEEHQRAQIRERATTLLRGMPSPLLHGALPVCYISALQAQRAQRRHQPAPDESGIPALRALLREALGPQVPALLLRARTGRALRYTLLLRDAVSHAGATPAQTGTPRSAADRRARALRDAVAAATALLEGIPGAVHGAASPVVAALRQGSSPAEAVITPVRLRALTLEARVAAAASLEAAQQATELTAAQARAAFLTRSLPAPSLIPSAVLPSFSLPEATTSEPQWRDESAAALLQAVQQAGEQLQQDLAAALAASAADVQAALPPQTPPPPLSEEERRRMSALHALEDDLVRLQQVLERCLDRGS